MSLIRGRSRRAVIAVITAVGLFAPGLLGASSAQAAACTVANPTFAAPPPSPNTGVVLPARSDSDGVTTLTVAVEDPPGGIYHYSDPIGQGIAVYSHRWPSQPNFVTFGFSASKPNPVRVPVLVVENPPSNNDDLFAQGMAEFTRQSTPFVNNSTPYALNAVAPTGVGIATAVLLAAALGSGPLSTVPVVGPTAGSQAYQAGLTVFASWITYGGNYPVPTEYQNLPPTYLWTAYRTAPGAQAWSGYVIANNGAVANSGHDACRRVRIGSVVRTQDVTKFVGGLYLEDAATGSNTSTTHDAHQSIVVGATTAALDGSFVDVPLTRVEQNEHKQGGVLYPAQQQDTITAGVEGPRGFVPLIGVRSDATHAAPPNAQHHTIAVGAFDPLGTFHPLVGAQTNFEKLPADLWLLFAALGEVGGGGIADPNLGDWNASLGVFGPTGDYIPAAGTAYANHVDNARDHYQVTVSAGPYAAGTYVPVLAATYDGTSPLNASTTANPGRFLVSTGAVTPAGYVPVAGASFDRANHPGVDEEYRVGVFTGRYPDFVPVAGANWHSSIPSTTWAAGFALSQRAPASAAVDVGPVVPAVGFVPAAGLRVQAGSTERYGVGAWAAGGFIPLLEACRGATGTVGVGAGPNRTPVAWVRPGAPPQAGAGDC